MSSMRVPVAVISLIGATVRIAAVVFGLTASYTVLAANKESVDPSEFVALELRPGLLSMLKYSGGQPYQLSERNLSSTRMDVAKIYEMQNWLPSPSVEQRSIRGTDGAPHRGRSGQPSCTCMAAVS